MFQQQKKFSVLNGFGEENPGPVLTRVYKVTWNTPVLGVIGTFLEQRERLFATKETATDFMEELRDALNLIDYKSANPMILEMDVE